MSTTKLKTSKPQNSKNFGSRKSKKNQKDFLGLEILSTHFKLKKGTLK